MAQPRKFAAKITQVGLLEIAEPALWWAYLARLKGQVVFVSVERLCHKRTLDQNAYYWAILDIIADWSGHEPDELHEYFKAKFQPKVGKLEIPQSTTELDIPGFTHYVDRVKLWAAEQGLEIPDAERAGEVSL